MENACEMNNYNTVSSISENNENKSTSSDATNNDSADETIHSADISGDFYIHLTKRPINYFRNQLIPEISSTDNSTTESTFPNFKRTIVRRKSFDPNNVTNILKKHHNNKQTAILAPENIIPIIQASYKKHFYQNGHFVIIIK